MLTPGARVGHYEVLGSLGKGGMGEVYRAKDTRLGREVALKVLPDDVAADRERLARFEREARLLAALNHPHVAAIYGTEEAGSSHALVMEVAEGPTLLERLRHGPIPVDEALPIARQMAEALEYAHERGIIHRDLKPANVKVTADGTVKLLDFGLAKALAGDAEESERDSSESPTLSHQATRAGVILGTASYMSPEQARGKTVDRRTDIWSFGVVLLEMLTGRPTFTGESVTDVLAAVVTREPDLGPLPPKTPRSVRRLLRRCLDKDPRRRLRDVGEARVALESPDPDEEAPPDPGPARMRRHRGGLAAVAALGAVAALLAFVAGQSSVPNPLDDLQSSRLTYRRGVVSGARFSPDGQTVLYSAAWDGEPLELFSVRTDVRESRTVGIPGAGVLAVSSTGELAVSLGFQNTIGFESTGTLARVPLGATAPREILEHVMAADWGPDGRELAVARDVEGTRRLEYPLGRVLHESGGWLSRVRVSPDGRSVAFVDHPNRGDNQGALKIAVEGGEVRTLAPRAANGVAWAPSGDEIYFGQASVLYAVDLNGRTRTVHRELAGLELLDVSRDGQALLSRTSSKREMYGRGPGDPAERNLSWLDWSFPALLSEDGRTVVFEEQNLVAPNGDYALFVRPTDGSPPVRLGDGRVLDFASDGRLLIVLGMGSSNELLLLPMGAGETESLGPLGLTPSAAALAPTGTRLVMAGHTPGGGTRLHVRDLEGGESRPLSPEGVTAFSCAILSPDGRWAFATGPDGRLTLYPVDEDAEPQVVPGTSRQDLPIRWTSDGDAIYVESQMALPARVERVDVTTGERRLLMELSPPDPAGVLVLGPVHLTGDGRAYVYSYKRLLDELHVLDGLR